MGVVGAHLSLAWMEAMSRFALALVLARDPSIELLILSGDGAVIVGPNALRGERLPKLAAVLALGGAFRSTASIAGRGAATT